MVLSPSQCLLLSAKSTVNFFFGSFVFGRDWGLESDAVFGIRNNVRRHSYSSTGVAVHAKVTLDACILSVERIREALSVVPAVVVAKTPRKVSEASCV